MKEQKEVDRKFQKLPYPEGKITIDSIPFVGPHAVKCLQKNKITTGNQLAAMFISVDRDHKKFSNWLFQIGITGFWADRITIELSKKKNPKF